MSKLSPSDGDRIDIGGKLPQLDVFADLIYTELVRNNLEWIRIADPKALKLDDIQYATRSEIHAFQVKWSNQVKKPSFTFNEFQKILPELIKGWDALKEFHYEEDKIIVPHFLTNKKISKHDVIKYGEIRLGSFDDFIQDVFFPLKYGKSIKTNWIKKLEEIRNDLNIDISKREFLSFLKRLEINYNYSKRSVQVKYGLENAINKDLILLSRFIIEEIGDVKKNIHFTYRDIVKELKWESRLKTTFQHELIIDSNKYQPIIKTINELERKLQEINNGYIFLSGSPGSGKSTLLNQWSKNRKERIIRYFAFDFTNPSSIDNNPERGEAINLLFDLIVQLKNNGVYEPEQLPNKDDLLFLVKTFGEQLKGLGNLYKKMERNRLLLLMD